MKTIKFYETNYCNNCRSHLDEKQIGYNAYKFICNDCYGVVPTKLSQTGIDFVKACYKDFYGFEFDNDSHFNLCIDKKHPRLFDFDVSCENPTLELSCLKSNRVKSYTLNLSHFILERLE